MLKSLISAGTRSLLKDAHRSGFNVSKALSIINTSRQINFSRTNHQGEDSSIKVKAVQTSDSLKNHQDGFIEFYRFPYIRIGYYLHKLKWYQTIVTAAAVPISSLLCLADKISWEGVQAVLICGGFLTLNLHTTSLLFHEAVGFMYLSEDKKTVKISYLNIWGNRINKEFSIEEIMPLSDAPESSSDILYRKVIFFTTKSPKPKLYLSIKSLQLGIISDKERFATVFGSF